MRERALVRDLEQVLEEGGLRGSFLVRDLDSGEELALGPDLPYPTASLVKIPLALATVERVHEGELDGARTVEMVPGRDTVAGPAGLSRFRHRSRVAVEDLLYLATALSDNTAAQLLFDLTPPERIAEVLRRVGVHGITVRHGIAEVGRTPMRALDPGDAHLALELAIGAHTEGHGHPVRQLDVTHASSGSARAYVDLLQALWRPTAVAGPVAAHVRGLMGANMLRHRLSPDFASDSATWSSKTGTVLNCRHEIGVVEHADGQVLAVAALTESQVPAAAQPGAEALMGRVARRLHDHLRAW
ncbi:serine hydrolase [Nocardiopsis xinjiangensis]|uniref:serine hydrolase n=1 Tax=Nocardiopsis xinjiangensis TaxID=124285 RepID=UPI00034C5CF1|nr:serine hydrolase [Nocardiopsis xinjiangensis]